MLFLMKNCTFRSLEGSLPTYELPSKDGQISMQDAMKRDFEITASEDAKFAFTGMICDYSRPNLRRIFQSHYIKRLRKLPEQCT